MAPVVFYRDATGAAPVQAYLERVARSGRPAEVASMLRYIDLLAEHGTALAGQGTRVARLIDGDARIFELRPGNHRIAYAAVDSEFVLLHAWRKRTQRLDAREIGRARANLGRYTSQRERPQRRGDER